MKINIRQANISDLPTIQKLNNEVFADNSQYDPYLIMDWPFNPVGKKYFKNALTDNKYCCLIVEADINNVSLRGVRPGRTTRQSQPIGYLVGCEKKLSYRNVKMAEIANMGVSPEFRCQGIGSKLIAEFKKWAKSNGFQTIYVEAYSANSRSIKFYQHNGLFPWSLGLEGRI